MRKIRCEAGFCIWIVLVSLFFLPSMAFSAERLIVQDGLGATRFVVTDNGSVGIGTAIPAASLDISPGAVSTDVLTIGADDTATGGNVFQLKIMGHAGGGSHSQITSDLASSRLTIMASERDDQAPRVAFVGPQDPAPSRGWALFDYGSMKYELPDAQLQVRYYNPSSSPEIQTMMKFAAGDTVSFPQGNMGVGTTAPTQKLEVNGGVRLNTFAGRPACDSSTRGTFWISQGATDDIIEACIMTGGVLGWRAL